MEKSIEDIWAEGFLKSDALVAPKINNLYTQKSIHIIDKFKRMFKINLVAIVVFSFFILGASYVSGIPLMGLILFMPLMLLVLVNKRLLSTLETVDKGQSSYHYLLEFNQWINKQIAVNKRMSTFLYPIIVVSIVVGFWFNDAEGIPLGERLVGEFLIRFPDLYLVFGIPLIGIGILLLVLGVLAYSAGRIYLWDVKIIYGRVFKKLEELLSDLEDLRG